ncbi:ribonuclease T2 [Novosphingobium aromaticivorans DSM 12444]|uniref:Ribonuclease T2 n=1 Tax=Novosphingobium aromaticivorans (strain ATCC 700278 / DSM 12444 / CCUG 56034 / CIP 105152 / NBRC 16084 / F199) TaxID=279238 RepID=Q2GBV1_NOVAD|nr:ribonuclease T2 [Novosphingobium aromaticivorans]ABD24672.1 ribonuclease T2 [Novosphingobium aromaticivorans DSM 12444]SCY21110.1 ribonuclease T2 [Novosphingobium aromaticivorans]
MIRQALALLLLSIPGAGLAQGWQCSIPPQIAVPRLPAPDAPPRLTPITGYTLAASWSPEFCRTRKDDPRHATQCSGKHGRFGFVLHGLWPEGRDGQFPQYCPSRRLPDAQTLRRNFCTTPSADLMMHEWARHGTCMSADPAAYFDKGRALFQSLRFPDMARLSRTPGLDASKMREAMSVANPQLRPDMIRLLLGRDGWLREVHVCLSRRMKPARCPGGTKPADTVPVKIWRSF